MAVITRSDQTPFVLDAYREQLFCSKRTAFVRQLQEMTREQGSFTQLYRRTAHHYEAVFAKEPGFLLGETIRHYFHANTNLIFCESLEQTDQLILVIIKEGQVFLDRLIDADSLQEELLPLAILPSKFQIVLAGIDSNNDALPDWCFSFTGLCASQEILPESVLERLPLLNTAKLIPIEQAVKSLSFTENPKLIAGLVAASLLVLFIGLFTYREHFHPEPPQASAYVPDVPAFLAYRQALNAPTAQKILLATQELMQRLHNLSGWSIVSVQLQQHEIIAHLKQEDGSLTELEQLAKKTKAQVAWTSDGIIYREPITQTSPTQIPTMQPLTIAQTQLLTGLQHHTIDSAVELLETRAFGDCKEARLTITFHDLYLAELSALQNLFSSLPIVIQHIELSVHDWQIHTVIKLSLWGT